MANLPGPDERHARPGSTPPGPFGPPGSHPAPGLHDPPGRPGPYGEPPVPPSDLKWLSVAAAFVMACVLPSIFFLAAALSEDPTASRTAGTLVLWLIGFEVFIGAAIGALTWVAGNSRNQTTRRAMTALMLSVAALSGFVTGFLGGLVIALERHPTWDDA